MTAARIEPPSACAEALAVLEADALDLPEAVRRHLRGCPACAEARVLWLAQEEAPLPLVPAGYFDRLPARVAGKLPARPRTRRLGWLAAAAALLALAAGGGFWAGRANREPLVEASVARPPAEVREATPEVPFHDRYEVIEQMQSLSPEEARALLRKLESREPGAQP